MNVLVLLAIVVIGGFTVMGFRVGLVRRVVEFLGVVVSFYLATNLSSRWSQPLAELADLQERVAVYVAWVALFLVGLMLTRLVAWAIGKSVRISIIGWLDRLGGAAFGLLTGTLFASVILIALTQLPGGEALREAMQERALPRVIYRAAPTLYDAFQRLGGDEEHLWEKLREKVKGAADTAAEQVTLATIPSDRRG